MAASLGEDLIFDMDSCDTGPLEFLDRAKHVQLIAITGIGVTDQRNRNRIHDPGRIRNHLGHRDQAIVGIAQCHRCTGTGHVSRLEPRPIDGAPGDAIDGTGGDDHLASAKQRAKCSSIGHFLTPAKRTRQIDRTADQGKADRPDDRSRDHC